MRLSLRERGIMLLHLWLREGEKKTTTLTYQVHWTSGRELCAARVSALDTERKACGHCVRSLHRLFLQSYFIMRDFSF